jgi:RecA/RadA recombinase
VKINKLPTGVPGLDEIVGGGLPEFSFNIVAGAPGSGKTTLAHQFVFANAKPHVPSSKATKLDKLKERNEALQEIAKLWKLPHTGDRSLWAALTESTHDSLKDIAGILTTIEKAHSDDFGEFLRLVQNHCKPWASRRAFIDEMRTIEKGKKRPSHSGSHTVRIMTMQSSKGLQANNVFIVG